jgi:imidazolonepropionase-like amidohydrolase
MRNTYVLIALICTYLQSWAQKYFPENGPANPTHKVFALTNATIHQDANSNIENAIIVVRNGRIDAVGKDVSIIPKDALIINLKGKHIYPAFIDLFTNYGIKKDEHQHDHGSNYFIQAKANMPYGWNAALKAEFDAASAFAYDPVVARNMMTMGFGAALTHNQDGICRGTAAMVHTANTTSHQAIMIPKATAAFSFQKGSSMQPYPSSLMGSIALLRQAYYDALWHKQKKEQTNLTLDAMIPMLSMPAIFEASNSLDILRADKMAKEFKQQYIIKTAGDEYRHIHAIKQSGWPLIVPINFPKAYQINHFTDAERISTTDLMHWEYAPYNLYSLQQANINFAITANGCEDAQTFWNNLRKAIQHGADKRKVLQSLTENPAKILNIYNELGSLHKGKLANMIITDQPLFEKNTRVLETWSMGIRHILISNTDLEWSGNYSDVSNTILSLIKEGKKLTIVGADTIHGKWSEQKSSAIATVSKSSFILMPTRIDSTVYPYKVMAIDIRGVDSLGRVFFMQTIRTADATVNDKQDTTKVIVPSMPPVLFPFTDYGRPLVPTQNHVVFKNATVWTSEKEGILTNTDVAIKNGKIIAIGKNVNSAGVQVIDATNMHLTAGIIDEHSHIAIERGVNEGTQAVTAEVRIGDAIDNLDVNIYRQLSGGVVAAQLLHGSANPIGGQSALIKLRWGQTPEQMKIEQAPGFIKFALGENVKQSNWGDRAVIRYPQTRMGVEQVMIDAFTRAREYEKQKEKRTDLELDALVEILNSKRFISCHSYVQSEINMLMHVADNFGFTVNTFTHILEGYKLADKMKKHGAQASTFADWWAYKFEVIEAIPYNAAVLNQMGVNTAVNSDDAEMGRRLNQEAAKGIKYGGMSEIDAWNMVTINPAKMLKLDTRMGSIKVGKDADLVLWTDNPLSIYAKVMQTYVDGRLLFDRNQDETERLVIKTERQRIIYKMGEAIKNGEPALPFISKTQIVYHCDTENEEEHEH